MLCGNEDSGGDTGVEFLRKDSNQMKWGGHSRQRKLAQGMASWEDSET